MTLSVRRLPGNFGARIDGVDVRSVDDRQMSEIARTLLENRFIVFPHQQLSNAEYIEFGTRWGRPVKLISRKNTLDEYPEMIVQGNGAATPDHVRNVANHWHCDSSYEREVATATMLYGVEAPAKGGETLFADLVGAYRALPTVNRERYDGLIVSHATSAAMPLPDETIRPLSEVPPEFLRHVVRLPPVTHPLVQRHPYTGRKALYGLGGSAYGIEGMTQREGSELILELRRHAVQPQFRAGYKLMPSDVLIWDNFSVMHRATPIEYSDAPGKRRLNYRISLKGIPDSLKREPATANAASPATGSNA